MGTFLANWKTTVLGLVVSALYIATQQYTSGMTWKQWALAAGVALWGALMKDFNTTGGTVAATTEAAARVAK